MGQIHWMTIIAAIAGSILVVALCVHGLMEISTASPDEYLSYKD